MVLVDDKYRGEIKLKVREARFLPYFLMCVWDSFGGLMKSATSLSEILNL